MTLRHRQPVAVNKYLFRTRYGEAAYLLYTHVLYMRSQFAVSRSQRMYLHTHTHYTYRYTHSVVTRRGTFEFKNTYRTGFEYIVHLILIVEPAVAMQESRVNYPHNSNRYIAIVWWRR